MKRLKGGKVKSNPLDGFKPILKTCPVCGKSFMPNINQKYCSVDCRNQAELARERKERHERNPLVEKICPTCGKSFMQDSVQQIYCSKACRDKFHVEKDKAKRHELRPLDRVCPVCGKSFVITQPAQVYCSKDCFNAVYRDYFREYRRTHYQPDKPKEKTCPICGKIFMADGTNRKYCSPECKGLAFNKRQNAVHREKNPLTEKTCPRCGKTFMQRRTNQIFCSPSCVAALSKQKHRTVKQDKGTAKKAKKAVKIVPQTVDTSKVEIPSTPKKICPTCGKYFTPRHSAQIYCSNKCAKAGEKTKPAHQFKVIEKTCAYCGKTFKTDKYAVKTCPECVQKFAEAKKARLEAKKKHICLQCGKVYSYHSDYKYFCSAACKHNYNQCRQVAQKPQPEAERRDPNKKTIEQWQKEAEQCGMSYGYYRAQIERFGKTFEELVVRR